MQTFVILASGPSLKDEDVEYVKQARQSGKIQGVVAISNVGIDKAPWADFLISFDTAWWRSHPEALEFSGRKFSCRHHCGEVEQFVPPVVGCNSGLMGMFIARDIAKAERLLLLGFDMQGSHYFGPHGEGLKNTTEKRFQEHIAQFRAFTRCEVINCTLNSALTRFQFGDLRAII